MMSDAERLFMSLLTSLCEFSADVYLSLLPTFQLGFYVTVVEHKSCLYTFIVAVLVVVGLCELFVYFGN